MNEYISVSVVALCSGYQLFEHTHLVLVSIFIFYFFIFFGNFYWYWIVFEHFQISLVLVLDFFFLTLSNQLGIGIGIGYFFSKLWHQPATLYWTFVNTFTQASSSPITIVGSKPQRMIFFLNFSYQPPTRIRYF